MDFFINWIVGDLEVLPEIIVACRCALVCAGFNMVSQFLFVFRRL